MRDNSPRWLVRSADYLLDRFDLAIVDHGVFRFIYPNRHKLSDKAWRSAQPAPSDIALFARRGVRTVVFTFGKQLRSLSALNEIQLAVFSHHFKSLFDIDLQSILADVSLQNFSSTLIATRFVFVGSL